MPHYKFPICIWSDDGGPFYAALLEWAEPIGMGGTRREAIADLKQYMAWRYTKSNWMGEPEFSDPVHSLINVQLRPAYQERQRRFPLSRTMRLPVHVVHGRQKFGGCVAVLPLLNERLQYHESDDLEGLVRFVVQSHLDGSTPRELSRYIPPPGLELDAFSIHVKEHEQRATELTAPETLRAVADPVAGRQIRSLYGKAWQRDALIRQLLSRVRDGRANVLLVGETGAGKTTVLVNAARECERMWTTERQRGELTHRHRFWQTNAGRLIAGMRYLGQWEERLEELIDDLNEINGCLCIESLADFVQTGGSAAQSGLAAFCLPYLQRRELQLVAEATPGELDACRRLLPGFDDLFQIQEVPTMDEADSIEVLRNQAKTVSRSHTLELADKDIAATTVRLFRRFLPYQALPGEASSFLGDTLQRAVRNRLSNVTNELLQDRFIQHTGLDRRFVDPDARLLRDEVHDALRRDVIGQDEACRTVCDVVLRFKAGLSDPQRPLGVLLFCGPTGVGKTELARSLSKYLFGGGERAELNSNSSASSEIVEQAVGDRLIRLDMSEYAGPLAAERLLRQASGDASPLLQRIRQQPFSVVLLDEVEKANPAVYDVLLNVFDEGRMTDEFGRLTYFRNAVIIMTSNLGATDKENLGFETGEGHIAQTRRKYMGAVREFFRPEFFNRFDSVIPFDPLSAVTIRQIAEKELQQIAGREGLTSRGIQLQWTTEVVETLARLGFDPRFGARPLQRALEMSVVSRLSRWMTESPRQNVTLNLMLDEHGGIVVRDYK